MFCSNLQYWILFEDVDLQICGILGWGENYLALQSLFLQIFFDTALVYSVYYNKILYIEVA